MIIDEIKKLRNLQHLVLIEEEALQVGKTKEAEKIKISISKLEDQLDAYTASLYSPLRQSDRIFLSPISKGNCSACGTRISTNILQHVISGDSFQVCPQCGRILYLPDFKSNGLSTIQPDGKFPLARFSSVKLMKVNLKATNSTEAITELGILLAKEKVVDSADTVINAALEREKVLTTAVGNGLAFPHIRGVEDGVLTFAAGVSYNGIQWGNETVYLVIFSVFPLVASPAHLKLIRAFAKTFIDGEALTWILSALDNKQLWRELNRATRATLKGCFE